MKGHTPNASFGKKEKRAPSWFDFICTTATTMRTKKTKTGLGSTLRKDKANQKMKHTPSAYVFMIKYTLT